MLPSTCKHFNKSVLATARRGPTQEEMANAKSWYGGDKASWRELVAKLVKPSLPANWERRMGGVTNVG